MVNICVLLIGASVARSGILSVAWNCSSFIVGRVSECPADGQWFWLGISVLVLLPHSCTDSGSITVNVHWNKSAHHQGIINSIDYLPLCSPPVVPYSNRIGWTARWRGGALYWRAPVYDFCVPAPRSSDNGAKSWQNSPELSGMCDCNLIIHPLGKCWTQKHSLWIAIDNHIKQARTKVSRCQRSNMNSSEPIQ